MLSRAMQSKSKQRKVKVKHNKVMQSKVKLSKAKSKVKEKTLIGVAPGSLGLEELGRQLRMRFPEFAKSSQNVKHS